MEVVGVQVWQVVFAGVLVHRPSLLSEQPRPFSFGKTTRAKISGWAQKNVGDRKLRKKKLGAAT